MFIANGEQPMINSSSKVTQSRAARQLPAMLIDQIECGLAACAGDGRLLHANRNARRELDDGLILRIEDGIVCCKSGWQSDFAAAVADAAGRQRSRLLTIGSGEEQLSVAVMPTFEEPVDSPTVVLMFGQRRLCSPLGLEMLGVRHRLTHAEQRVLKGLVSLQTPREIAWGHGVTLPTIRTQIQSIREKVGVRSVDALLLRAAQVPPVSARPVGSLDH